MTLQQRPALSAAQRRLWFIDRLMGPQPAYHIVLALDLHGQLNVRALQQALEDVVERHEALRTVFPDEQGEPWQRVLPAGPGQPPLRHACLAAGVSETQLEQQLADEADQAFDLVHQGPLRALCLRLSASHHVLQLVLHHIAGDGWSIVPLAEDLGLAYAARCTGHAPAWSPLPLQYIEFSQQQARQLGDAADPDSLQARQRAYWVERLQGAVPLCSLPTDRPRPAQTSHRGATLRFQVPAPLLAGLMALARAERATLFMVLQTAMALLLNRQGAGEDIVVGSPIAGREDESLYGLVGFFANTWVLRSHCRGEDSLLALLRQVRQRCLEAYRHQSLPFDCLVEALRPERSLAQHPLFQIMLVLQNNETPGFHLDGLQARQRAIAHRGAKFDLSINLFETRASREQGLAAEIEYATDLYDEASVQGFARRFIHVLDQLVRDPQAPVGGGWWLLPGEREALLRQPAGELFDQRPLHEQLLDAATRHAHLPALRDEHQELSYAELAEAVQRQATVLRRWGVGRGVVVGLHLNRGVATAVAQLAVLAAGGAFLPLDPAYPAARLAFMLGDARPLLVLSEHEAPPQDLTPVPGWRALAALQAEAELTEPEPLPPVQGADLAYVIYTSGSTGQPKGVLLGHRGLSHLTHAQGRLFDIQPGQRVLQFASLNFDASVSELATTLAAGALLCIPPREALMPGAALQATLQDWAIEVATLPPVALNLLDAEALPELRLLITAGEACPAALAARWLPGRRLLNAYGPTELTVCASAQTLNAEQLALGVVPIGQPIANARAYVLDEQGEPVPVGVTGELWLGGEGLAWGYLGQPGLTAERFVPDALSGQAGARLYRSGDLARWRRDGTLEFLGRKDDQLKLRGIRVELGEVQGALAALPGVQAAAVLVQRDAMQQPELVGALVAPGQTAVQLRQALAQRLPEHLLPGRLLLLEALPQTANGKVDKAALERLLAERPREDAAAYEAPQTELQQQLAQLWQQLLGCGRVGLNDHFFLLGGHSLLAAQLMARAQTQLGVALPLKTLFEAPVLAQLAARFEQALAGEPGTAALEMPAGPAQFLDADPAAAPQLSRAQQRLWVLDQLQPGAADYVLPTARWLQLDGEVWPSASSLAAALGQLLQRHQVLRTALAADAQGRPQALPLEAAVDVRWQRVPAAALDEALQHALLQPFDLARGPLLRAQVWQTGAQEALLLIELHHAVADGWSVPLLWSELGELWKAAAAGLAVLDRCLAPLPLQFHHWARAEQSWLDSPAAEAQRRYWQQALAGAPAAAELPLDRPRSATLAPAGAWQRFELGAPQAQAWADWGRAQGLTPFMAWLALLQLWLVRLTGQAEVCVGAPVSHRPDQRLEGLIGFFVNTVVLRGRPQLDGPLSDWLRQVREQVLAALAHQDLPFDAVVEALQPRREPGRTPLFEVMLVMNPGQGEAGDWGPGLRTRAAELPAAVSKFDLSLLVQPQSDGRIALAFEYRTALFDAASVAAWADSLLALQRAMMSAGRARLAALPLLSTAQQQALLLLGGGEPLPAVPAQGVLGLYRQQALRQPEADALVLGQSRLSHGALHRQALALARRLRSLGVRPGDRVALCASRSLEMGIGLMGILLAGAAYVPIDPHYPAVRRQFMLEDSQPRLLLSPAAWASETLPWLDLAQDWAALASQDEGLALGSDDWGPSHVDQLAYLIYTSGSTGQPKGVAVAHRSLWASTEARWRYYGPLGRYLLLSSFAFDSSVAALFGVLGAGGCLVMPSDEALQDPAALARLVLAQRVNTLLCVPSLWQEMLLGWPAGGCGELQRVILAGEACPPALLAQTRARWPALQLFNEYGPTEASVWSSVWHMPAEEEPAEAEQAAPLTQTPIGRPIAGARLYVLDERGELLPPGAQGELCIGGRGVSQGYAGRPGLSAERFGVDPWGEPGTRLYRSGDRVRWRHDGQLEFLGRFDHQLKLRGLRVELGEIEAALTAQPGVREAVVLARALGSEAEPQLIAYLGADGTESEHPPVSQTLRDALLARLPSYMVPAHWVWIERWPLTPNGKIDRAALPDPQRQRLTGLAAQGAIEQALAPLFAELLGLAQVGREDNFFELGGSSLLAVKLHRRIDALWPQRLQVVDLFRWPTVQGLAQQLQGRSAGSTPTEGAADAARLRGEARRQRLQRPRAGERPAA
ncbi:non-ribosomal peptide synthetase [Kinneretia aquatilis]|uniref:non-ribosomal peptide synthetase n=1 Tax=Kinneretia aquatilis TaxID=2070761 RepID=UPI0014951A55|nr:non-ribosomal peptide synthetase [Paucibacter aquatile]WIV98617.1 non-ribosomal peptide synthetase [Paucibacter aquatile]